MPRKFARFTVFLLILSALSLFTVAQDTTELETNAVECVTEYAEGVDYFPEKATFEDAQNVAVEYFDHYKVVSVNGGMGDIFTYVLVQCGTPEPETDAIPEDTAIIEVPTGRVIALSTTQIVHLVELGLLDQLAGLDSFLYVNAPEVRALIDEGEQLVEVAPEFSLNIEIVLEAEPEIVLTDDFDRDRLTALADAEIFAAVNTDYLEQTPLGRAEWIKYTALFYNAEAEATAVYDEIVANYEDARALAASVPADERPVVLWNAISPFSDTWGIPGADTYAGTLIQDAGGIIALIDQAEAGTAFLAFEVVYEGALDADIWVTNLFAVNTLEDILAIDARYEDFAAVETGEVWNNDADVNENGGSNYFERGVTNPDIVLRDLVALFHPELLPDHEFAFFRRVAAGE